MRIVAHLSDLHFGRVDAAVVAPLVEAVHAARPDVTVVSGDFVQNGTSREFEQARDFVRQLPEPRILVPGNHDLPFANIVERFAIGLRRFQEYITDDLEPFWSDGEIAVMGISTARAWPLRGGRVNQMQVRRVAERLCSLPGDIVKVLVTHHPFDLPDTYGRGHLVGRARMAMASLARTTDILLAGHMHVSQAGHTALRYELEGRSAIFVQAGTATSTRGRGEPNAFNLLRVDRPRLLVERHRWHRHEGQFRCAASEQFALWTEQVECPQPQMRG